MESNEPLENKTEQEPQVHAKTVGDAEEQEATSFEQPKTSKFSMKMTIIAFASVLLVLAGVLFFLQKDQPTDESANTTDQSITDETVGGTESANLVEEIRAYIETNLPGFTEDKESTSSVGVEVEEFTQDLFIESEEGESLSYVEGSNSDVQGIMDASAYIEALLVDAGFEITSGGIESSEATLEEIEGGISSLEATYENDNLVCSLFGGGRNITFICIDKFRIPDEIARITPFVTALESEFGPLDEDSRVTVNTIEETDDGYEIATGGLSSIESGGFTKFYRTLPDGVWMYSHGGQAQPSCEEFTNADQRIAFAGESCYPTSGSDTTVGEFYKL